MKSLLNVLRMLAIFAAGVGSASAQRPAEVGRISYDNIPSPVFDIGKAKNFTPKDWLELEVGLKVPAQNQQQVDAGFIDRVVVKWYVAVNEKTTKRPVLMTKDVTHINVPVDQEVYSAVYLSPNTLMRLTGSDRATKGAVEVVGMEILVDGVRVGAATTKMEPGWWNSPNLSRGDRFPLLDKSETPFKMLWWDRYAEVEEQRR